MHTFRMSGWLILAKGRGVRLAPVCAILGMAAAFGQVPASPARPTTFQDVAPILFQNCTRCHHEGGPAPFSLRTYRDAGKRARQIAAVTKSRFMPPWLPEPGYGNFTDGGRLTDAEIDTIQRWAAQDGLEGPNTGLTAAPSYPDTWALGPPDLVLRMTKPYLLPAEAGQGRDVFRNFVLRVPVETTRYVRAIELRPGNPRVFHHANILVDRGGTSRDRETVPGRGFEGMDLEIESESFDPDGYFLSWKPGSTPVSEKPGMGWRLDPDTDLVVNLHMRPSGKPEVVDFSLGLYFAETAPTQFPMLLQLENDTALNIPPGAREFVVQDAFVLPVDVEVLAIYPHAHYLGKTLDAYAMLPNGSKEWLIRIADWNLDWQGVFRDAKPVFLPKGSTVYMRWAYDNSAGNVRNPNRPLRRVVGGNQATDEMGHLWLQVLAANTSSMKVDPRLILQEALMRHRVGNDPNNYLARYNLGSALQILGKLDQAADEYRHVLSLRPEDAPARNSLGTVLQLQGKPEDAMQQYLEVLRLHPGYVDAQYNIGRAFLKKGELEHAVASFADVLRTRPEHADAHHSLGIALQLQGKAEEAIEQYRDVLRLQPGYPDAEYNLGRCLIMQGRIKEAIASFETLVRARPDDGDAHHGLGLALIEHGDIPAAQSELEQAVRLKPGDVEAHNDLGTILARQGRLPEACAQFQEAVRIDPRDAEAHYNLGRAFAEQGKLAEAVTEFEESLRLRPENADVHNDLGIVFARMGRPSLAAAQLEEAIRINPALEVARENLNRIKAASAAKK